VLEGEWNVDPARPFNSVLLGQCRHKVTILVIVIQMASIRGLPKSEAIIIMNVGSNGTAPCVTIKLLIHSVHAILRRRGRDTTRGQFKQNIAIEERR
jgi:hypothetical protein